MNVEVLGQMGYIKLNDTYAKQLDRIKIDEKLREKVYGAHRKLYERTGKGNEFLGWVQLPESYDRNEFNKVKELAKHIQQTSEILLVIGVGGSYLGARAAIELLSHTFYRELHKNERKTPKVLFAGHNLSSTYVHDLMELLDHYDVTINVISKSGSTLETAVTFRIFEQYMYERYSTKEVKKRIIVTTDAHKGPLRDIASEKGYETLTVPDDIGGRYSVLTSVGLLPIAVSNISIEEMMHGAQVAMTELKMEDLNNNPAQQYAAYRHLMYEQQKHVELLVSYDPQFHYFQEWWKQLFGESEGKDGKGIFPARSTFSTDLHSIGQYIQDGKKQLFQTVLHVHEPRHQIHIPHCKDDLDQLNYLANKSLHDMNEQAFFAALHAHTDGNVPSFVIEIPKIDPFTFGYLVYFFEIACAISSYLLDVNPFDQPGVEAYKSHMHTLLTKK